MELAIKMGFENSRLTAYAVSQDGKIVDLPPKDLYKRGLPMCAKPTRRRIDTDLASWSVVDGQAYFDAFGFKDVRACNVNHLFFEVKNDGRTFVVPALAFMRTIFRPTKWLLAEMFMPQALDRQCRLVISEAGVSVGVDASWAHKGIAARSGNWMPLFTWLMAHPSARDMAGSVHAQAMGGAMGLKLPKAVMRMVFRGHEDGMTMFVTDVSITTITPRDKPMFSMLDSTSEVTLFDRKVPEGKSGSFGGATGEFNIARHKDGSVALTDSEWEKIESILLSKSVSRRLCKLPQRYLLDGVLLKLASGQPWKNVAYTTGNWSNACSALRSWSARGAFDLVLRTLEQTRAVP